MLEAVSQDFRGCHTQGGSEDAPPRRGTSDTECWVKAAKPQLRRAKIGCGSYRALWSLKVKHRIPLLLSSGPYRDGFGVSSPLVKTPGGAAEGRLRTKKCNKKRYLRIRLWLSLLAKKPISTPNGVGGENHYGFSFLS